MPHNTSTRPRVVRPAEKPVRRRTVARPEEVLVGLVVALVSFGIVMVYSSSSFTALLDDKNPLGFTVRQILFALIGLAAYFVATRINLKTVERFAGASIVVSFILLVAVLLPSVGIEVNGSRRWLPVPVIGQIQPSEFAKLSLIVWIAALLAKNPRMAGHLRGITPFLGVTSLFAFLILMEPDLGTATMLFMVAIAMLAVSGAQAKHLAGVALAAVFSAGFLIAMAPYRRERMLAFLDPWSDPQGNGFQVIQAQVAVGTGGLHGVGLGDGLQKAFYLPEAHTDMILATIGEELGFIGILAVLLTLAMVVLLALRIAIAANDPSKRLIAVGLTVMIGAQTLDNAASVLGMMPITGVPLPFVSYGGSNLIMLLFSIGILVNIARSADTTTQKTRSRPKLDVHEGAHRREWDGGTRRSGSGGRRSAAGARG